MEYVLIFFTMQGLLGAFDTIYHHELTEGLPWKSSAHKELKLHGIRNFFYAIIFLSIGWLQWHGVFAWVFIAILILEVIITLWDFVEEDLTRKLPATERVTHTILAINYGVILALFIPIIWRWSQQNTAFVTVNYGWLSWVMMLYGTGVLVWAFRDYLRGHYLEKYISQTGELPMFTINEKQAQILVTGGTGFIGTRLCQLMIDSGHQVTILTRDKSKAAGLFKGSVTLIDRLDTLNQSFDIVINLAGAPISVRWTDKAIKTITDSRLGTTQQLIDYIERVPTKPKVLISGSAIGYYGNNATQTFTESTPPAEEAFTHILCRDWESIALKAEQSGVRVCLLRTGVVLGLDGGVVKQLRFPFEFFVGGKIDTGRQMMSWIHMDDLLGIIGHCINDESITGPVNGTAPEPVDNARFSHAFAQSMHRPAFMTTPGFMLKLMFGEMAQKLLLEGQSVVPEKALQTGYTFKYPKVEDAFNAIFKQ